MNHSFKLKIYHKVEKQLQRIPKKQLERMVKTMRSLCEDPRPSGCVKLEEQLYRVRQGQYRIIYAVFDDQVIVVICKVARRSEDTYKNIKTLLNRAENVLSTQD